MCNNRAVDLQDTSLEVTPDIAGNISFQSFLLNLEYFMLNSKYTIQTLCSSQYGRVGLQGVWTWTLEHSNRITASTM